MITTATTLEEFDSLMANSQYKESILSCVEHTMIGFFFQKTISLKRESQTSILFFNTYPNYGEEQIYKLSQSNSKHTISTANQILGLEERPSVLTLESNLEHLKYVTKKRPIRGSLEIDEPEVFGNSFMCRVRVTHGDNKYILIFFSDNNDDETYFLRYTTQETIDAVNALLSSEESTSTDWNLRKLKYVLGEINTWSKDPSTKVSAAIFKGKYPICSSYNGFPPGVEDTEERLNNRPLKYKLVQHAEANCITTCARLGIQTEGMTMAISLYPCTTCAGMIIGAGIKEIITQEPTEDAKSRWQEDFKLAEQMFNEAGVKVTMVKVD